MPVVDLAFFVQGTIIPSDHGYALYSAICHVLEDGDRKQIKSGATAATKQSVASSAALSSEGHLAIGVHPINGQYIGSRQLQLNAKSRLRLRASTDLIPQCLALAGKSLDLDGHRIRVGVPTVYALTPAATLVA